MPILLLLLVSFPLLAANPDKTFGDVVADTIYRVYDGDTFYAGINDWPPIIGDYIGIRVAGIDTPEMRDKRPRIKNLARKARALADSALTNAQKVELRAIRRGKYFRIVADVYCDGHSLADLLLAAGLAHPYSGGKKISW
jgi:endonuclease YncB( thermonuclease family)